MGADYSQAVLPRRESDRQHAATGPAPRARGRRQVALAAEDAAEVRVHLEQLVREPGLLLAVPDHPEELDDLLALLADGLGRALEAPPAAGPRRLLRGRGLPLLGPRVRGALGRAASPGANLGGELLGTALTLLAALCSSLAGVSFQGLLQGSAASLWTRNCQLAGYGFAAGLATLAASPDWRTVASAGFFHGYTALTWTCIAMNSCGGLVVGMALKYADAILKDMAIGLSICVSAVGAMLLFGFVVNSYFIIGSTFVIYGTVLYTDSLPAFSLFNPRRHPEPCRPYLEVEATELGAAQARG
mmetsp:Transcript_2438/g.6836  ORF Transcript_2438/g.6836 Transcript_2438/m.6836 type:complete len:302 (-) Transcript_2438:152-1057(-)